MGTIELLINYVQTLQAQIDTLERITEGLTLENMKVIIPRLEMISRWTSKILKNPKAALRVLNITDQLIWVWIPVLLETQQNQEGSM